MARCPYCDHDLNPVCGQCKKPIKPASEYAVACCDKLVHERCFKKNASNQLICLEHWKNKASQESVHVNKSAFDQWIENRSRW